MPFACRRIFAVLMAFHLFGGNASAAGPARYNLDPVHTRVMFAIDHAGFSKAIGTVSGSTGISTRLRVILRKKASSILLHQMRMPKHDRFTCVILRNKAPSILLHQMRMPQKIRLHHELLVMTTNQLLSTLNTWMMIEHIPISLCCPPHPPEPSTMLMPLP